MIHRIIFSVLLALFCIPAYSQSTVFRSLSGTEGLTDLTVSSLYKDSVGYVWLGTATSVERFDGIYLKHYPIPTPIEKHKYVNCFVETKGNRLWIGTDGGFWSVKQEKVERVAPDVIKNGVRSIVKDSLDVLYIGSESGIHIYRDGTFETILLDTNAFSAANFVIGLWLDKGTLWSITKDGLYSMELASRKIEHYPNGLSEKESDFSYRNITRVGNALYIGTMEHGVLRFDLSTHTFHRYVDVGCNAIRSLSGDGKDLLYVGTDGNGACCLSTSRHKVVRSFRYAPGTDGIRSNTVYSFLVDVDGGIWLGLCQMGLDYVVRQDELFSLYETPYFTSKDIQVRTLYIGKQEKLIGSRNGLYYINEQAQQVTQFTLPFLRSQVITTCCALKDKVYIGTYGGGMYIFDLKTKKIEDFAPDIPMPFTDGHIFCITPDKDGNLWIGTSDGIYRYKDRQMTKHFTVKNSHLPEGNVYAIFFDSTGKGWIGTEGGIGLWNPATDAITTDAFPEGFIKKEKVSVIYEDSQHELYFLPYKGRMFISSLDMNSFHRIQPDNPLEGKNIMFITEDREGWLWLGTSNGLYRYDKKETFASYNFADGIPSPIFLACTPVMDEDGSLWFGNSKGLLHLPAGWKQKSNSRKYKIRFSAVRANGQQIVSPIIENGDGDYSISLSTSQNNMTVCFSGFTYTDPGYMSYEYRMEGVDKDWQTLMGKSEVTYYDLPSGKHAFKVRQMGNPDSEVCLQVNLSLPRAYLWAMVSAVVCLAMLAVAYYVWRRKTNRLTVTRFLQNPEAKRLSDKRKEENASAEEKYKTSNLPDDECKRLTEQLKKVMSEEKPYTNPDLKIADLASAIGISSYSMSYLFNQYLKCNYYDYVNDYRIAEFKYLVNKGEHHKYTLSALIELCGFSSRTSFFRHFKKMNGITPSEYIKSLESDKNESS